jgi:hypothetical protein
VEQLEGVPNQLVGTRNDDHWLKWTHHNLIESGRRNPDALLNTPRVKGRLNDGC